MKSNRAVQPRRAARALLAAALMLVPVFAALAPMATAAETVPFADGQANWVSVPGIRNYLYFHSESGGGLDMDDPTNSGPPTTVLSMDTLGPGQGIAGLPSGENAAFPVANGQALGSDKAVISSTRLTHEVNVTGDNAITVVWYGEFQENYTWTVSVKADPGDTIGSVNFRDRDGAPGNPCTHSSSLQGVCTVPIKMDQALKGRYTIKQNSRIVVEISASGTGGTLPVTTSWSLRTDDPDRPSGVEIRAENAIKVATWTTDKDSRVSKVFRPLYRPEVYNRVDAFFAVKSAFGRSDLCRGPNGECLLEPESSVMWRVNRTPFRVGPQNLTTISLLFDENTTEQQGVFAWRFPAGLWDVGRWPFPQGDFLLESKLRFRTDDPRQATELKAAWEFIISTQALSLRPYDDDDPETLPTPLESQAHEVAPGGSTTFLVLARNGGMVHDNLTIDVNLISAQPPFGWQARVGGEGITGGNRLYVPPGEERLFLVTVTAPPGASNGQSAVYEITAQSGVDPETKSKSYTVIATASNSVRQDVGIVVLKPTEKVRPGQDNLVKAFVWNRGTRPTNVTFTVREQTADGWNVSIRGGNSRYQSTVPSVPAGDVAPVFLVVRPDAQLSVGTGHNVTLNATIPGTTLGARGRIDFTLTSVSSFRVELLRGIGEAHHYLEMNCEGPGASLWFAYCDQDAENTNDSMDGTWFRAWVTNTGDVAARYTWFVDDLGEDLGRFPFNDRRNPAFPESAREIQAGFRDPKGRFSPQSGIDLSPSQTAEVYVWVPHQQDSSRFAESNFTFEFVVNNTLTQQQLRRTARVAGWDSDNEAASGIGASQAATKKTAVKIEAVERTADYYTGGGFRPIVKIDDANKASVTRAVDLSGRPQYFYARVTNGASWKTFTDDGRSLNSSIDLALRGIQRAKEQGWNITMRAHTGETDERKNPWKDRLFLTPFSTENGRRWESFWDQEIEIQVRPPINGSARVPAGESRTFTLEAKVRDPEGDDATATLEFVAVVSPLANVTIGADTKREFVHAGKQAAFALTLSNNGSIEANVSLKARLTDDTPNAGLWTLSPKEQNVQMFAHENRTLALIVGAPQTATVGDKAIVNVSVSFPKFTNDRNSPIETRYVELTLEVKQAGKLRLTALPSAMQTNPGGLANFTLELRNADSGDVSYAIRASPLPNWEQSIPESGRVSGTPSRFAYILRAPVDVFRDRSYASVVKVVDTRDESNFDVAVVQVNIVGGQPFPIVSASKTQELVDRDGQVRFEMGVKNLGNTPGVFPLEAKVGDPRWSATVQNANGQPIRDVTVKPNELVKVFLVVRAPRSVPEGTAVPATLTAFNPTFDRNSAATVRALIHDYGVDVEVRPPRADVIAGQAADFNVRVTNLGNGNDTLNLSADLASLGDWSTEFSTEQVTLPPGQSTEVRLVVRTPKERLPVPRSYTMTVFAGSLGGAGLGLPKNDSAPLVVSVLNYRAFDVDDDGFLELAVDRNKRASDGFEEYREIYSQGLVSQVVDNLSGKQDGKLDFLLDVPGEDGAYDGVADLYYDPNEPFVYAIEFTPDINGDATPDYLLDTDNDGVIDHAWDTATRTLWTVTVIKAFGGNAEQYLIDLNNDGKADRYYDPAKNLVTKTIPQSDGRVGIVTDRDDRTPSKFFDAKSGKVQDARVGTLGDFFLQYWYFPLGFLVVLVLFGAVLARRRRA